MSLLLLFLSTTLIIASAEWPLSVSDNNGGTNCIVCTLLAAFVQQTGELYDLSPMEAFSRFCGYLTEDILHDACDGLRLAYGPRIAVYLDLGFNPDEACFAMNFCTDDDGPMCRIFPPSNSIDDVNTLKTSAMNSEVKPICNVIGVKAICKIIERWTDDHYPVDDLDGDRFSDKETMRGSNWRGRDCADESAEIRPGRIPLENDRFIDSNCNGIYGVNNWSIPYEDLWCRETEQFGVAVKYLPKEHAVTLKCFLLNALARFQLEMCASLFMCHVLVCRFGETLPVLISIFHRNG